MGCGGAGFCGESDMLRVVKANEAALVSCYNRARAKKPGLKGKVVMKWRIGLDGKTFKVLVESTTLNDKSVEDCLRRQLEAAHFPKPKGGMCQIRYPFRFN